MRKTLLIVAVLLVFVFGIFGIPKGVGPSAWKNALTDRIHLGLDLKGGIHLVLQVMVQEAVGAETDNAVARVQADLQQGLDLRRLEPREHLVGREQVEHGRQALQRLAVGAGEEG